jgi:hypothetical protein
VGDTLAPGLDHEQLGAVIAAANGTSAPVKGAPTTELGSANPSQTSGIVPWTVMVDDREYAPDLVWPGNLPIYQRMETDAQVAGLSLGTMLPIRRFRWQLDPQEADMAHVEQFSEDTGIPILGQKAKIPRRRRGRFSHDRHLAHALRKVLYGHYYFEQVGKIETDSTGAQRWHLRKLATRPPRTIAEIQTDKDGGLRGIKQHGAWGIPPIPVDRLVAYVWNPQDDADWLGTSMLRPLYRNWLVKDRLIRVDATKHERNGMGVPWFEVDPAATDDQIRELAATAMRWRSGEAAGGAGPGKLRIAGVEGNLPDTIASIRWHDQQMARAMLQLFVELGQSDTGSRALGDSLIDWYVQSQDFIAQSHADTFTEHVIEDWFDWNYGEDVPACALVGSRDEEAELAADDLAKLVQAGVIVVDDELEDAIRETAKLPKRVDPRPKPPAAPPPPDPDVDPETDPDDEEDPPTPPPTQARRKPQPLARQRMADRLEAQIAETPGTWPELCRALEVNPKDGTARRARDGLLKAGKIARDSGGRLTRPAIRAAKFRRDPLPHEVAAGTDFADLLATVEDGRAKLIDDVKAAQAEQIDQVQAAIAGADGDLAELATIDVEPIKPDVIRDHLDAAAAEGRAQAEREAKSQGVKAVRAAAADEDDVAAELEERASAITQLLRGALVEASRRQAVQRTGNGVTAGEVADQVREYLDGLSDAFLEEQLGGALMQAMNAGRREFMRANSPTQVYASELLDDNTCDPCADVDGTEYPTVEDSEADYPAGGFVECEGGLRCRGTIVAVYTGGTEDE